MCTRDGRLATRRPPPRAQDGAGRVLTGGQVIPSSGRRDRSWGRCGAYLPAWELHGCTMALRRRERRSPGLAPCHLVRGRCRAGGPRQIEAHCRAGGRPPNIRPRSRTTRVKDLTLDRATGYLMSSVSGGGAPAVKAGKAGWLTTSVYTSREALFVPVGSKILPKPWALRAPG
jgi:hypothetical protein